MNYNLIAMNAKLTLGVKVMFLSDELLKPNAFSLARRNSTNAVNNAKKNPHDSWVDALPI